MGKCGGSLRKSDKQEYDQWAEGPQTGWSKHTGIWLDSNRHICRKCSNRGFYPTDGCIPGNLIKENKQPLTNIERLEYQLVYTQSELEYFKARVELQNAISNLTKTIDSLS